MHGSTVLLTSYWLAPDFFSDQNSHTTELPTAKLLLTARAEMLAKVERPTKVRWEITSSREPKTGWKSTTRGKPATAGMQAKADTLVSISTSINS
jgi:hypothetical protein